MKTDLQSNSLGNVGQDFNGNKLRSKILSHVRRSPERWRDRDPKVGRGGGVLVVILGGNTYFS